MSSELDKEAAFLDVLRGLGGAIKSQATNTAAAAVVGLGVGAGYSGASFGAKKIQEHFGKQRDFKAMIEANPNLGKMDAGKVQMTYNSLRKMAPSLASDPLMAGSFVRKTLEMSDPPYVDPQTMKMLSDTQKNISTSRGGSNPYRDMLMGAASRPVMDRPQQLQREDRFDEQGNSTGYTKKHYG